MTDPETTELATCSPERARQLIDKINYHAGETVTYAATLKAEQGHLALGYESYYDMARAEFRGLTSRSIEQRVTAIEAQNKVRADQPELFDANAPAALMNPEAWEILNTIPIEQRPAAIKQYIETALRDPSAPVNTAKSLRFKCKRELDPQGPGDHGKIPDDIGGSREMDDPSETFISGDTRAADMITSYVHRFASSVEKYPAVSWTLGEIKKAIAHLDEEARTSALVSIQGLPADEALSPRKVLAWIADAPVSGIRADKKTDQKNGDSREEVGEWGGRDKDGKGRSHFPFEEIYERDEGKSELAG